MYDYGFCDHAGEGEGTILRYNNVMMEEQQMPLGPSGQWSRSGLARGP